MKLRDYQPGDIHAILALFHSTVHCVNAADYTPAQLDAWAPEMLDQARNSARGQPHRDILSLRTFDMLPHWAVG